MSVLRTKSVEQSIRDTEEPEHQLKKSLGTLDLIVFGVGVIIGAGIFVLTGTVAASNSGPAIALSFAIAGLACALAALCYAEFASTVPVAGSAYTFSYATFGELVAWIIGWDLVLEFTIGSAALSTSFSSYLQTILAGTPLEIPVALASAEDGLVNLPAVLVALAVMTVLILGIKFSSRLNQVVVAIKLAVVLFVIVAGLQYVRADNYSPFIPRPSPRRRPRAASWTCRSSAASSASTRASTASRESSRERPSCSSRSSGSTSSRPPPRRRRTRSVTSRAASWARWPS